MNAWKGTNWVRELEPQGGQGNLSEEGNGRFQAEDGGRSALRQEKPWCAQEQQGGLRGWSRGGWRGGGRGGGLRRAKWSLDFVLR